MLGLTSLTAPNRGIADLDGLEFAENLTDLWLSHNQISDITPLAGLANLMNLFLHNNPLNALAYCVYLPLIEDNNPGIVPYYDPNPNPLTNDCSTDMIDFAGFSAHWQETNCDETNNWCGGADLNHSDDVTLDDLAEFAQLWRTQ